MYSMSHTATMLCSTSEGWSVQACGDLLVCIIVVSLYFAVQGKKHTLQGFSCLEVYLECCIKVETGMCINRDATPDYLLSFPDIWDTEEWVYVCQLIQNASLKSNPTEVAKLTLPCRVHPYVTLLYNFFAMWCSGYIKQ